MKNSLISSSIPIPETNGDESLVDFKNTFKGYFDPYFFKYDTKSQHESKQKIVASLYRNENSGTFMDIYSSLGVPLKELALTQGQILSHLKNNDIDNKYVCYLFKGVDEYFVALIYRDNFDNTLVCRLFRLESKNLWSEWNHLYFLIPNKQ